MDTVRKATDIRPTGAQVYFLPVQARVPLKFGTETLTKVTCARACVRVADQKGGRAEGWGETPLSVQWVWPSAVSYAQHEEALQQFCLELTEAWALFERQGHPMELGQEFLETVLPKRLEAFNQRRHGSEPMPWLAALVCCSPFELALHDAYGKLHARPTYETYTAGFMN